MDNFFDTISSSSDDDSEDNLVLHALLSATQDMVHERGKSWKHREEA